MVFTLGEGMRLRHSILIAITFCSANVFALIPSGLKLNEKAKASSEEVKSESGFHQTFLFEGIEVQLKGTRFTSDAAARQMSAVEYANILKLYLPRGNPYEGQISDLIQCSKAYQPKTFQFKVGEYVVPAVSAGTNERKLFGACSREQIAFWAVYFSFFYPPSKMVIEARLFKSAGKPTAAQMNKLDRELQKAASSLLSETPK